MTVHAEAILFWGVAEWVPLKGGCSRDARLHLHVQDAISVIETDCEVDFAPPLDYVEPKRVERAPEPARTTDDAGVRGSYSAIQPRN